MAKVEIILGSESDLKFVNDSNVRHIFTAIDVSCAVSAISAHRNLHSLMAYCRDVVTRGEVKVFIAGAGMAAALPGTIAAAIQFRIPVIGVPLATGSLGGFDAAVSMLQMPRGVPVAVVGGVGAHGFYNAGLLAVQMLATENTTLQARLERFLEDTAKPPVFNIST